MKIVEDKYQDQSRWNRQGRINLAVSQEDPEQFIIEPAKLSKRKLDLIEMMPALAQKRIVEFGSGRGELSVALAKLGGIVTGVDVGGDLIKLSRKIAAINQVDCEFIAGSIHALPLKGGDFDVVVGHAILHHLPKPGVVAALNEAYRLLKPGGMALFVETIENSPLFDFIQNLVPAGRPGSAQYRPSILQRTRWRKYLREVDDRALTNLELTAAGSRFREVEFVKYYGLLIRLGRLFPQAAVRNLLTRLDYRLTHRASPLKTLSQSVLVVYRK